MSDTEAKDQESDVQRKRGRPSKPKPESTEQSDEPKQKRPRGRPKGSKKKPDESKPKRPRGRPRKAAGDVEASAGADSTDE